MVDQFFFFFERKNCGTHSVISHASEKNQCKKLLAVAEGRHRVSIAARLQHKLSGIRHYHHVVLKIVAINTANI